MLEECCMVRQSGMMAKRPEPLGASTKLVKFIPFNQRHKPEEGPKAKKEPKPKIKVKTGCITCRIRKVKCDEGKPACHRCTSTGRKCDGYAPPTPKKDNSPRKSSPLQPASKPNPFTGLGLDIPGANEELRFLEFFQLRTAPTLSGYFDEYFWRRLILQVSQAEPTVRHALAAVSSVHEQFEIIGPMGLYPVGDDQPAVGSHALALLQYNRAIVSLNQHLSRGDSSLRVTLICCILFVCLEFLRGNTQIAMTHFSNGLNILRQFREQTDISPSPSPGSDSFLNTQLIEDYIVPIFSRLSILSLLFDQDYSPVPLSQRRQSDLLSTDLPTFSTISEARNVLIDTLNPAIRFVTLPHIYNETYHQGKIGAEDVAEKNSLEFRLETWLVAFESFLECSMPTLTKQDRQGAIVLKIQHRVVYIWLSTRGSIWQKSYDDYIEDFDFIIKQAESLTSVSGSFLGQVANIQSSNTNQPPSFVFDLGVIPVLYFTAIKCRHPQIRRKAIALLSMSPRREGLWDADTVARVSERIMQIEEEPLDANDPNEFPPEWSRVHDADFQTDFARPGFQQVRFTKRPVGCVDGELVRWEEYI